MNDSRFEWKVGLFVFVGLALAALLILNFSKGTAGLPLHLQDPHHHAHGGRPEARRRRHDGRRAHRQSRRHHPQPGRPRRWTSRWRFSPSIKIRQDARFHIDALGFLGDQYIEVTPAEGDLAAENKAPLLTNGETIAGETPLNMQEAVRSISGFVEQGQKTMQDIDKAVNNVNNTILDAAALTNFVATMTNFGSVTEDAASMAKEVRAMLDSNLPSVRVAITNFAALSQKLNDMADQLDRTISTNTGDVTEAVKSIKAASASLQQLADGLQAGQGLAGSLLKDEKMKTDFTTLLAHISDMAEEYARFGQTLNENSLWHRYDTTNPLPPTRRRADAPRQSPTPAIMRPIRVIRVLFLSLCIMGGYAISQLKPDLITSALAGPGHRLRVWRAAHRH